MCAWILIGGKSYVGPNGNAWNKHGNRNLWDEVLMGCHKGERVTKEGSTGYTMLLFFRTLPWPWPVL